jgi:hypothetical protein
MYNNQMEQIYYDLQVNPGTGSTIAAGEGNTFFEAFKLIGA